MLETKPRILIVDDYPALVTLMRHKLVQRGFEVLTAQNGDDALRIVEADYPDLVISDVEMPVMNGYELCSNIKTNEKLSHIPVILVTSLVTTDSLMKGISVGADNYLTKPYDDETLFAKVDELLNHQAKPILERDNVNVFIDGKNYKLKADYSHLINLLVSTYKNTLAQNMELENVKQRLKSINNELEFSKDEYENLLQNIFPRKVADSLLAYGTVAPERYNDVTIMFTDFDDFTKIVPSLTPEELIESLSFYFDKFDEFAAAHNVIKIKTIGDSYMAVGGMPDRNSSHPIDVILTALEMKQFINEKNKIVDSDIPNFPLRIGIHTGSVVVGVIGKKRFAYDVWGDAVNLAARMEQNAEETFINISETTYQKVKDYFDCEPRGEIEAKNMGRVPMYNLMRIKPEYSEDEAGLIPNRAFIRKYTQMVRLSDS